MKRGHASYARGVREGIRIATNHVARRAQTIANMQGGHLVNGVVLCGDLVDEIRAIDVEREIEEAKR